MYPPKTLSEMMAFMMRGKRYEPTKRVKDLDHVPRGMRNFPVAPRHVAHRFPIRGGITFHNVMAENLTSNNSLLKALKQRHR